MPSFSGRLIRILPFAGFLNAAVGAPAAQNGNSATVRATVTDPSSADIPGATVTFSNAVSVLKRTVQSDPAGQFVVANLPFNPYNVTVSAPGFGTLKQNITVN